MSDNGNKEESSVIKLYEAFKKYLEKFSITDQSTDLKAVELPGDLTKEKIDAEIKELLANETGMDRVKALFEHE